ncbi:MAG TPA: ion transporter [Candidatus Ozemobacteraceae bacterium]|nr:ion transporter [Candidatus Ozemobacteraceae bacterium]
MEYVSNKETLVGWRRTWHEIIFEADTPAGKAFDVTLITLILSSVLLVMVDSVAHIHQQWGEALRWFEWGFTLLFSLEYLMRLNCVTRPLAYATSFYGVIDLLAILPSYLGLVVAGSQYLMAVRVLRVLRVFRIFKLTQYLAEANLLLRALRASLPKIVVFTLTVSTLVIVIGSVMYVIEGPENGFTSIPIGIYWAIVTLTTVGFGDVTPKSGLGQMFACIVMILGYGIIAVPTGIVTAELTREARESFKKVSTQACMSCSLDGHDADAAYCKACGAKL